MIEVPGGRLEDTDDRGRFAFRQACVGTRWSEETQDNATMEEKNMKMKMNHWEKTDNERCQHYPGQFIIVSPLPPQ